MSQSQTQLSQSEIDEIITKRFIEKSLGPGTLITRLQTIASVLPRIDQEDDDKIAELSTLVSQLGKNWIFTKKNTQIKLLLACIFADILRIYAPEQPYTDEAILTKIFRLMISSLDGVQTPDCEDYGFHFRVLESISTVQSYIVMNDLENEQLLMLLTHKLFSITKEKTIKLALTHITDILCGLINDLQVIPEIFLKFILHRLIEPYRSKNPNEYDLAVTVIRRCTGDLKLAIEEYIHNTITHLDHIYDLTDDDKSKKREKQLREDRRAFAAELCVITELSSISTEFVENALLNLEECLQNERLEVRLLFVNMFASIFTQISPSLSREWSSLFRIFLKRYDDVSIEIREFMANITCVLLQTQYNFVKEIQEFCIKRIEDVNERIRKEITKQVCMAAIESSSNSPNSVISVPLFNKLLQRTLDKKAVVRYCAIEYSSKLFGQHLNPYWRMNKKLPSEMRVLLPIPKKLMSVLGSIDFSTKIHLESVFDAEMIGNQHFMLKDNKKKLDVAARIEERMNVILGIVALLPDESKRLFHKYFMREKYQLQALINKILTTYNELRMAKSNKTIQMDDNADSEEEGEDDDVDMKEADDKHRMNENRALERQYEISYSNFNQRFPLYGSYRHSAKISSPNSKKNVSKPSDYLKEIIESPNSKIRHYLQNLCSTSSKLKATYNCSKHLLAFVHASTHKHTKKAQASKLNEFAEALCTRISNVLFSCDAISVLLNKMVAIIENDNGQPCALLNSGIFLLNCLCDEIPNIFDAYQCLTALIKLFNFHKTYAIDITRKLSFVSLRILAKSITPNSFDDEEGDGSGGIPDEFLSDLIEKAKISSNYEEAQLATECIIKCTGKYSAVVQTLCEETSKELDITEQYLPTLLSTLSLIAKLSPNIFISRAQHITQFIMETLLPFDLNENDGIYQENNIEEEEEVEDAVEIKQRHSKRGRKKTNKSKKAVRKEKSASPCMTPTLLTSKQCGIQILVNYLLSIVDLPKDELGINSVGISPIKSATTSPTNKNKKKEGEGLNLEDIMNEAHEDSDNDINLARNNENDVQIMEESDPFNKDNINVLREPISPEIECDRILDALFGLIRKYGQINIDDIEQRNTRKYSRDITMSDKKERKKAEISMAEMRLVNMSVDGILDIIREPRYRRLLGLLRFYELGFLIHHRNAAIRKHTLQSFWNKLRDHKLPTHYACIFPLIATDPNKKLRDVYRTAVMRYFERMRKENQIRSQVSNMNMNVDAYEISKLPEYLLFYLVHLLAHHPDFDEKLAKKELRDAEKRNYTQKNKKAAPFVGWRGRRNVKSDESGYDTSPSRMLKKEKKTNDKQEADDNENDTEEVNVNETEAEKKKVSDATPTSCVDYFGCIFDFYFDALLKGSAANQFPLIIKILSRIDASYDSFKPLSKGHRYLIRIAMRRLKKRYKGKSFHDFPGRVVLPKGIFKLRDSNRNTSSDGYGRGKNRNVSPRRVDRMEKHNKHKKELTAHSLLAADQSLLATTATATASDSYATSTKQSGAEKRKNDGDDMDGEGSDHPSDNDIVGEMDVSGLDISTIRRHLNQTLTDKSTLSVGEGNDTIHTKTRRISSSGSGVDADDDVNSAVVVSAAKQTKKTVTKKSKNIGRKRKRADMMRKDNENDTVDKNNDKEPPRKRSKRRGTNKRSNKI